MDEGTFLHDDQVENAEIGVNNATADRLALALTSPTGTVAGVPLAEQQAHTAMGEYTLLHGEALLVVASADAHYITLKKKKRQEFVHSACNGGFITHNVSNEKGHGVIHEN